MEKYSCKSPRDIYKAVTYYTSLVYQNQICMLAFQSSQKVASPYFTSKQILLLTLHGRMVAYSFQLPRRIYVRHDIFLIKKYY